MTEKKKFIGWEGDGMTDCGGERELAFICWISTTTIMVMRKKSMVTVVKIDTFAEYVSGAV